MSQCHVIIIGVVDSDVVVCCGEWIMMIDHISVINNNKQNKIMITILDY